MEESNKLKEKGNNALKLNDFNKALEFYTEGIAKFPTAILYSNRAQANIKLENYGSAILDSTNSIELDSNYLKGYYRRAVAYSAIMDYKNSIKDVKIVIKKKPNDIFAKKLDNDLKKIIQRIRFENAITIEEKNIFEELDWNNMLNEKLDNEIDLEIELIDNNEIKLEMTTEYISKMIEIFKNGAKLPRKHAFGIVTMVNQIFRNEESLVEIGFSRNKTHEKEHQFDKKIEKISICGDTHGQFYDVLNIFERFGKINENNCYLFNGDFVDRGSWSCEVALLLYSLKILYPKQIFINRGNHETNDMNQIYGFEDECKFKYNYKLFKCFSESFNSLPYATLVGQEYLIMHGGLFSNDDISVDDIRKINRFQNKQPPKEGIEMELLWTDPQNNNGRSPSKRGIGLQFGPDITKQFCEKNNLKAIIRSHEVRQNGYEIEHDGKLITVFSAPNYCDVQGNLGGIINFTLDDNEDYKMECLTFEHVEHPNIPPMNYTKNNMGY